MHLQCIVSSRGQARVQVLHAPNNTEQVCAHDWKAGVMGMGGARAPPPPQRLSGCSQTPYSGRESARRLCSMNARVQQPERAPTCSVVILQAIGCVWAINPIPLPVQSRPYMGICSRQRTFTGIA